MELPDVESIESLTAEPSITLTDEDYFFNRSNGFADYVNKSRRIQIISQTAFDGLDFGSFVQLYFDATRILILILYIHYGIIQRAKDGFGKS